MKGVQQALQCSSTALEPQASHPAAARGGS
jgi:hypothetical protein